jgi:hypothetical protein
VALNLGHRRSRDLALPLEDHAQAVSQRLCAPGLVDKVDGATIQRLQLPFDQGVSGQEDDRQSDPALSQRAEQAPA